LPMPVASASASHAEAIDMTKTRRCLIQYAPTNAVDAAMIPPVPVPESH